MHHMTESIVTQHVEEATFLWPNPELLQKCWNTNKLNYQNRTRYLCGKPMAIDSLKGVLKTGYQRQRIAAAIELAIRQPNTPSSKPAHRVGGNRSF